MQGTKFPSFIPPTAGKFSNSFGRKRFFNNEERAPHSGLDFPAPIGQKVVAPMPGIIIEIKVHVGDSVKKGQELIIIEAMKMHNPILAAKDGNISELFVKVNEPVQSNQPLLYIR